MEIFRDDGWDKSVLKSAAMRLNTNCSLDQFLLKRKTEYSRYFYASLYKPSEVKQIMDECTGITEDKHGNIIPGENRKNVRIRFSDQEKVKTILEAKSLFW